MTRHGPFPGMDPWLQSFWGNVHTTMNTYVRDALNEQLSPGLVAVTQQRVLIESSILPDRNVYPDVHVVEYPRSPRKAMGGPDAAGGVATLDEPVLVKISDDPFEQPYIEIIDARSGGRVVTVIELVSPSNKRAGEGRDLYLQKQSETVASEANLVEIDLTRGHRGVTLAWRHSASAALETAYHACAGRATHPHGLEVYPIGLRQRLPSIRIPLRPEEADVRLDLQRVLDETYRRGRLAELIDYARPPEPPLDEPDTRWAAEWVSGWRAGEATRSKQ